VTCLPPVSRRGKRFHSVSPPTRARCGLSGMVADPPARCAAVPPVVRYFGLPQITGLFFQVAPGVRAAAPGARRAPGPPSRSRARRAGGSGRGRQGERRSSWPWNFGNPVHVILRRRDAAKTWEDGSRVTRSTVGQVSRGAAGPNTEGTPPTFFPRGAGSFASFCHDRPALPRASRDPQLTVGQLYR
jgi:hypothetical protein